MTPTKRRRARVRARRAAGKPGVARAHGRSLSRPRSTLRLAPRPNNAVGLARDEIVRLLDDTFRRRNWGHRGLLAVARGLTVDEASWKPPDLAHTIWQQLNHIAYWRRNILERLRGRHPRWNQAWPRGGRTAAGLRRTVRGLDALSRELRAAIVRIDPGEFIAPRGSRAGRYSIARLLLGEAAHLSYHIGQITLTRRLYRHHGNR